MSLSWFVLPPLPLDNPLERTCAPHCTISSRHGRVWCRRNCLCGKCTEDQSGWAISTGTLDISLSYGEGGGWIGLLRCGWIGVDVMRATPVAEAEQVAHHYLGPATSSELHSAADPVQAFALAWTELEARLKCMKRELTEWPGSQIDAATQCSTVHITLPDAVVVAVATAPVRVAATLSARTKISLTTVNDGRMWLRGKDLCDRPVFSSKCSVCDATPP